MFQRIVILFLLSGVGCLAGEGALSDRDPKAATKAAYESAIESSEGAARDVAVIRLEIAEAYEELNKENSLLTHAQKEYERKDPIARGLREKVVAREKELVELRRSLQSRLEAIEEIRAIDARRQELLKRLQELKQEERQLVAAQTGTVAVESTREPER